MGTRFYIEGVPCYIITDCYLSRYEAEKEADRLREMFPNRTIKVVERK